MPAPHEEAAILRAILDAGEAPVLLADRLALRAWWASRAACEALGRSLENVQQSPLAELLPPHTAATLAQALDAAMAGTPGAGRLECIQRAADGTQIAATWAVRAVPSAAGPVLVLMLERPQGRAGGPSLPSAARDRGLDPLTGLPDRRLFQERLQAAWEAARQRPEQAFAVLFVDLDGFKAVNDRLGHLLGDAFLREFALRLRQSLRPSDSVARFGGDEFTALIEGLRDRQDAIGVARRILAQMERPAMVRGAEVRVTASIGIAWSGDGYEGPEAMLQAADGAMYRAKSAGPAHYACADGPPSGFSSSPRLV